MDQLKTGAVDILYQVADGESLRLCTGSRKGIKRSF